MKLDLKLISIFVLMQIVTGVLVFTITRAYYADTPATNPNTSQSATSKMDDLSTEELIRGLQEYNGQTVSNNPEEINQQANALFQTGNYAKAAALYQRIIELSPDDASAHNNLGLSLHYLGRSTEAVGILQRGTELQPDFQRVWLTLGFVRSGMGQNDAAKQALKRAVELGPETDPGKTAKEMLSKLP
jgi:tetratricopeptide (TPR) repeat protein